MVGGEVLLGDPPTVAGTVRLDTIDMILDFAEVYRWCDMGGAA
jgi:hypothetical protein